VKEYTMHSCETLIWALLAAFVFIHQHPLIHAAGNLQIQALLDNLGDLHIDGLVGASEASQDIRDLVSIVLNLVAEKLEGNNAGLAVLVRLDKVEDLHLVQGACNRDNVATGAQHQVVDIQSAYIGVLDEVLEGQVALDMVS
jgi:hypothetical protein